MSVPMRKLRTSEVEMIINFENERTFIIPKEMAGSVVVLFKDYEIDSYEEEDGDWVDAEDLFKDLDEKYTKPGARLRGARFKEEYTQVTLARKLGITQGDISKMEHGKRPIGKKMAKRLAKVLKIDYRVFL